MGLRENLYALMYDNDLNQDGFARKLGVSQVTVSNWVNEKKSLRSNNLMRICDIFGVTPNDILSDDGYATRSKLPKNALIPTPSSVLVPVIGTAHMGDFDLNEECDFEVEVPESVMKAHPRAFLVHGFGSCLNKRFPEDALLLIDPEMTPQNNEAVCLEDENHETLIRVFAKGQTTLMLSPDSYSDTYEDIISEPDSPSIVLKGVVVWYQAREDVRRR